MVVRQATADSHHMSRQPAPVESVGAYTAWTMMHALACAPLPAWALPPAAPTVQVQAYQQQLAALHLRVDNLLLERQRLQEEAAEQAAAAAAAQQQRDAELAQLRSRLSAAEAEVAIAGRPSGSLSSTDGMAGTAAGSVATLSALRPTARGSQGSEGSELASSDVTWGRTLTGRAPLARPRIVPPVDLARLRLPLAGRR